MAEEVGHLDPVSLDHHLELPRQGGADGVRADVGVAVHVAADPAPEANQGALEHQRATVGLLEAPLNLGVERRHDPVDHVRQVEEHVLELLAHGRLVSQLLVRLPRRGDVELHQLSGRGDLFGRHGALVEALDQHSRDALLLAEDRAPDGLGGVGGEHGLDQQTLEGLLDLFPLDARGGQGLEDGPDAAGLRFTVAEPVHSPADAVDALGHVHEAEVGGEGPDDLVAQVLIEPVEEADQLLLGLLAAAPPAAREQARALHGGEELLIAQLLEEPAEQLAEPANVPAQREVLGLEEH